MLPFNFIENVPGTDQGPGKKMLNIQGTPYSFIDRR